MIITHKKVKIEQLSDGIKASDKQAELTYIDNQKSSRE